MPLVKGDGDPVHQRDGQAAEEEALADTVTLEGTVIRKPWTKTLDSWNAGGSDYYVLDVGDTPVPHRSAKDGVILRPSEGVPFRTFHEFNSARVVVEGRFVEGSPWTPPPGDTGQHPVAVTNPLTGAPEPILRGSGFQVLKITRLDPEEAP